MRKEMGRGQNGQAKQAGEEIKAERDKGKGGKEEPTFNHLTAKCRIYPAQQEYCVRQLLDIYGDICLDYIGTWRQEYFVSGVYNQKKV